MTLNKILIIGITLLSTLSYCQSDGNKSNHKIEVGAELQLYPVGYMPMITSNIYINADWALRFRIGGNFANRKDFSGFNDDEVAKGFGGSVGLVRYFSSRWNGKTYIGATLDSWNMWTKWKDGVQTLNPTSGTTYNLVIQPWLNAGYQYPITEKWNIVASLGFGREINVITSGEKVGEGWMGIATISTNILLH